MVSLYKDPDGDKVFEAHDRALLAETLTNSMREFKGSGTGVDVIQQINRHLEDELTSSTVSVHLTVKYDIGVPTILYGILYRSIVYLILSVTTATVNANSESRSKRFKFRHL